MGADGNLRQYEDYISKTGPNQVTFVNATMVDQHPETIGYQTTAITFNAALPANFTNATQTAFGSPGLASPAYYATTVDSNRTNTVDGLSMQSYNGHSVYNNNPGAPYWNTVFDTEMASLKNTTGVKILWTRDTSNGFLQLPATSFRTSAHPTIQVTNVPGSADVAIEDIFADGTTLTRRLQFADANGVLGTQGQIPAGSNAFQYLSSLYVTDTLTSNAFSKGPIVNFGSAQSMFMAGTLGVKDPVAVLNGSGGLISAPDGLVSNLSFSSLQ